MVGDGLNDAPALSAAHVSLSPSTAVDVSQTAADMVFQGIKLSPILEVLDVARRSGRLVRQNFAMTFLYNLVTIPLAVGGLGHPADRGGGHVVIVADRDPQCPAPVTAPNPTGPERWTR